MKQVIIDTDVGCDIDDIWAICLLLSSEAIDVKMISVTNGDVVYKATLVAKILTLLDRTEIPIAIGTPTGGADAITPQKRWIGDFSLKNYKGVVYEDYVSAYNKVIRDLSEVFVIALGPFTSLCHVVHFFKEKKVKIIAMAGSIHEGYGFSKIPCPECNIVSDIPAAQKVLSAAINLTLVPLDACRHIQIDGSYYQLIKKSKNEAAKIVMENYQVWAKDYQGSALRSNPAISSTILYDLGPVWYLLFPQNFVLTDLPVFVDQEGYTRVGGKHLIEIAERLTESEMLVNFSSECYRTHRKMSDSFQSIGIEGRYSAVFLFQKLGPQLSVVETGWENRVPGSSYGPTRRTYYILHLVISGKGYYEVDKHRYDLKVGDCFLLPPDLLTFYGTGLEDPISYYWVGFEGTEAKELLEKAGFIKNGVYCRRPLNFDRVRERMRMIAKATPIQGIQEYTLLGNLYLIFADLIESGGKDQPAERSYVDEAIAYMNYNYNSGINIVDVAKHIGVDRTYFFRLFKEKTGKSPLDYLIDLRLEKAKSLLKETTMPIYQVASSVGYSSYVSFIGIFTKKFKMTPSKCRNEARVFNNKN